MERFSFEKKISPDEAKKMIAKAKTTEELCKIILENKITITSERDGKKYLPEDLADTIKAIKEDKNNPERMLWATASLGFRDKVNELIKKEEPSIVSNNTLAQPRLK